MRHWGLHSFSYAESTTGNELTAKDAGSIVRRWLPRNLCALTRVGAHGFHGVITRTTLDWFAFTFTFTKNRLSFYRIKAKPHRKSLQITTNHYKPPQSQRCGAGESPGDDVRSHVQAWAWNTFVGKDCRRFRLSPFWLSPFWFVAVLTIDQYKQLINILW